MFTFFQKKFKQLKPNIKGFSRNPGFYFGAISLMLFGLLFVSSGSLAEANYSQHNRVVFFNSFFKNTDNLGSNNLFFSQNGKLALETPDLKFIQDNSLAAVSTPSILTTQTLGDIFGGADQQRKDVVNYTVQPGDTLQSIADSFSISKNTVLWANDISSGSSLRVGQTLVILPVSGVLYVVKNGDTLSQIAKTYKANVGDIVTFNNLANEGDIFIGDTLILPDGIVPQKAAPLFASVPLADNFFIYPLLNFRITQGLHYFNAIDIQPLSGCGTPIYAAASGLVQRAVSNGGWNSGMGNHISILHSNGVVTYYGHLMKLFVSPGDKVDVGQEIALVGGQPGMPGAGDSTGCHVHWEVIGARNPLAGISVGTVINVNK